MMEKIKCIICKKEITKDEAKCYKKKEGICKNCKYKAKKIAERWEKNEKIQKTRKKIKKTIKKRI